MYRRGDLGQIARAFRLVDELRGFKRGRWVNEVANALGTSERTIRRSISELQDAGIDIEISKQSNRVFAVLTEERSHSPVAITKRERFTLLAVRRVFDVFARTPFLEDVVSVLKKLEQRMSDKERAEHNAFGEQLAYMPDHGTKSYEGKDDIIDAIQSGIINRKLVRYRYAAGRGRADAGYLAPFRLAMYRHGLYAIGGRLKEPTDDVSTAPLGVFAVERFTDAEYAKQHGFQIPENSRIREVLEGAFGPHLPDADGPHDVVVEFSAEKAHLVSSRAWHPTQQVVSLPSGAIRLSLRIPSLRPLVSWILEWGPHAVAVAPQALVENVRRELASALRQYGDTENREPSPS